MSISIKLAGWIVSAWFVHDSWVVRVSNSMPKVPCWNHQLGFFTLNFINYSAYGLFNNLNTVIEPIELIHWTLLKLCLKTFYFISNKLLTLQLSLTLKQLQKKIPGCNPIYFEHTLVLSEIRIFLKVLCAERR